MHTVFLSLMGPKQVLCRLLKANQLQGNPRFQPTTHGVGRAKLNFLPAMRKLSSKLASLESRNEAQHARG